MSVIERNCFDCGINLHYQEYYDACKTEDIPQKTIELMWRCKSFILHCCKCLRKLDKDTFEYKIALKKYHSKDFRNFKLKTQINIIGLIAKTENITTLFPYLSNQKISIKT